MEALSPPLVHVLTGRCCPYITKHLISQTPAFINPDSVCVLHSDVGDNWNCCERGVTTRGYTESLAQKDEILSK